MNKIKYLFFVVFLAFSSKLLSQDQSILIFDPNGVSSSFQYTLSQLTEDSVFVADSLDDSIYNYDAAFLFISHPYILSQANANRLINYISIGKPAYVFSNLWFDSTSIAFWNHIGVNDAVWLLVYVLVDSVTGIDSTFTSGISIDTTWYGGIPLIDGNVKPILSAWWNPGSASEFYATYTSGNASLKVILDIYNLIDDYNFLERVLQYFELIPQQNVQIQFFPPVACLEV